MNGAWDLTCCGPVARRIPWMGLGSQRGRMKHGKSLFNSWGTIRGSIGQASGKHMKGLIVTEKPWRALGEVIWEPQRNREEGTGVVMDGWVNE